MHNNLETSQRNFPNMCSTHSFEDKIASINEAKSVGMYICSGAIIGIGETFEEQNIINVIKQTKKLSKALMLHLESVIKHIKKLSN